jgi:hypothetical protein
MVKTDSDAPIAEIKKSGLFFSIKWRWLLGCLGLLLGSGTIAGLTTTLGVGDSMASDFSSFKTEQATVHKHIEDTLFNQDERTTLQDNKIEGISKVISSVQTTQQRDVARNEARRVTEDIKNRAEREAAYDRIYELNLKRLQRGADPCSTVACP